MDCLTLKMKKLSSFKTSGTYQPTSGTYQSTSGTYQSTTGTYQPTSGTYQPTSGTYQPTSHILVELNLQQHCSQNQSLQRQQ